MNNALIDFQLRSLNTSDIDRNIKISISISALTIWMKIHIPIAWGSFFGVCFCKRKFGEALFFRQSDNFRKYRLVKLA